MKKIVSVFLSLVIIISSLSTSFFAFASDDNTRDFQRFATASEGNNSTVQMSKLGTSVTTQSKSYTFDNTTYLTEGKKLYQQVRDKLVKHTDIISFKLCSTKKYTTKNIYDVIDNVFNGAVSDELSTSCVDGDYLLWQIDDYNRKIDGYFGEYKSGMYFYDLCIVPTYRTTTSQENEVDTVINSFIKSIDTSTMTDYDIVKSIHDFILSKTEYDYLAAKYINLNTHRYDYAFTAWGTLVKGKSVCQGYALAFYRIAKELGYNARFVYSNPSEGCHAWNIIELNNKYYYVDTTWDDDSKVPDKQRYLLVNYDTLRAFDGESGSNSKTHILYEKNNQATDYFISNYKSKIDTDNYDSLNETLLSNCIVNIDSNSYVFNSKEKRPKVTVKTKSGEIIDGYNYTVSYSSNVYAGQGLVSVDGEEDYNDSSSKRAFIIKPSKANTPKAKESSATSSSVTISYTMTGAKATGYTMYLYKDNAWKKVASSTSSSVKIKNLSPSKTYKIRVAEYKTIKGKNVYGSNSSTISTCTKPKATKISSITAVSKGFNVKWSKVTCSSYQVEYSVNSNMKSSKKVTVSNKSTSKKITGLKRNKKYYVRVRAVKTYTDSNGKKHNYYTSWSGKKMIKTK